MKLKRREFLLLMGGSAVTAAAASWWWVNKKAPLLPAKQIDTQTTFSFQPVRGAMPLATDNIDPAEQIEYYRTYQVVDDLVLPEGFQYQVIAAWGDKVGDSRFGFNNDYVSFVETGKNQGYLTVNFEYISPIPWMQAFEQVVGKTLPLKEAQTALQGKREINAFALPDNDPLKLKISEICQEALLDQGLGVISLRRTSAGKWERTNSPADRRISGISGLKDGRYLQATGPAVAVFNKQQGQGYIDKLGSKIIGSFGNCAGGTTPWGTVLSAEENFQVQVAESVYADGTPVDPSKQAFSLGDEELSGQGNVLGLAGNKYGWIVEVDPANPQDYGTKHTWLGRYRHEAVGVRVVAGKPLAFYSGCDRRGGHLYKFVSSQNVTNPQDKANSKLLQQGMLYAAKFNPDGTGSWIPLKADTQVNPDLPSQIVGKVMRLPLRPQGGNFAAEDDAVITAYKQKYKTLGDLYSGDPEQQQGAILIDAHYAANAAGATCTARPEDTEVALNGDLYISFTSGSSGDEGGPDSRIFQGPKGETPYDYGWVMRLTEEGNEPAATTFRWQMLATGGEPSAGGMGFANPDNLLLDKSGNLWMVTDTAGGKHNQAVKSRVDDKGKPASLSGLFGNNAIWYIPTSGVDAGLAYLFGMGPMECETTGPCFTPDEQTMFLAVQHPGEVHGTRQNQAQETRELLLTTIDGKEFTQTRRVPVGSNWPSKTANTPPRPAVVAIHKVT